MTSESVAALMYSPTSNMSGGSMIYTGSESGNAGGQISLGLPTQQVWHSGRRVHSGYAGYGVRSGYSSKGVARSNAKSVRSGGLIKTTSSGTLHSQGGGAIGYSSSVGGRSSYQGLHAANAGGGIGQVSGVAKTDGRLLSMRSGSGMGIKSGVHDGQTSVAEHRLRMDLGGMWNENVNPFDENDKNERWYEYFWDYVGETDLSEVSVDSASLWAWWENTIGGGWVMPGNEEEGEAWVAWMQNWLPIGDVPWEMMIAAVGLYVIIKKTRRKKDEKKVTYIS